MSKSEKQGMGCMAKGCLILLAVLLLIGGIAGFAAYTLYQKYTSATPANIPLPPATAEQNEAIQQRIAAFGQALTKGEPAELQLSADDINTMIAVDPKWKEVKGHFRVRIENNQLYGEASAPLDKIAGLSGRYFNGTLGITPAMENGSVQFIIHSMEVNGNQFSPQFVKSVNDGFQQSMRDQMRQDPKVAEAFQKLKTIKIADNKLVVQTAAFSGSSAPAPAPKPKPAVVTPEPTPPPATAPETTAPPPSVTEPVAPAVPEITPENSTTNSAPAPGN